MNQSIQELKIKLDQKVKEFIEEQRFPLNFFIIDDYIQLIKSEPLLKDFLARLEKQFAEKNKGEGHFDGVDALINLEPLKIKDGKIEDNLWFFYGILYEVSRGLEIFKSAYTQAGKPGVINVLNEQILPQIPQDQEIIKQIAPALDKKVFDKYLTDFNSFVVSELVAESYFQNSPADNSTAFDDKNSLLRLRGEKIKIARKNDETNSHFVLKYIFENGKTDKHFYSEMAEKDDQAKSYSWKKYFRACEAIQDKIRKDTKEKIDDFLIIKSGKSGWVQINSKYL